ncbi:MAG: hypothetical protein J4469_03125 [Candidatus Aenigmarchaeota archaeon]|nr:hypothetical protein [Candidatus Aenigmarchaeota archaeon]
MAKTTIQLEEKTRNKLKSLGTMNDTYDSLIERLVEFYEEARKREYFIETQHKIAKTGKFVELD